MARDIRGVDPVTGGQLTREELDKAQGDENYRMKAIVSRHAELLKSAKPAPKYTPVSRRQDRPDAIAWFVRNHPEVTDAQIAKMLGTTKSTIESVRNRTHWNSANIKPVDPVTLGLVGQLALDEIVKKAADKKAQGRPEEGRRHHPARRRGRGRARVRPRSPPTPDRRTDGGIGVRHEGLILLHATKTAPESDLRGRRRFGRFDAVQWARVSRLVISSLSRSFLCFSSPDLQRVHGGPRQLLLDGLIQIAMTVTQFANTSLDGHGLRLLRLGTSRVSARFGRLWNHIPVTAASPDTMEADRKNGR